MTFHGIDCNFKPLRASDAELLDKTQADLKATPKNGSLADAIRYQCIVIDTFFRHALGESYSESLNPDAEDLETMGTLFAEFVKASVAEVEAAKHDMFPAGQAPAAKPPVLYQQHGKGKRRHR